MTIEHCPAPSAQDIHEALDRMAAQTPALGEIIAAFRPVMAAQAALMAELPLLDQPLPQVDPSRLAQGTPLARVDDFLACAGLDLAAYLERAVRSILPALGQGFPALAAELQILERALAVNSLDAAACLEDLLGGHMEPLRERADKIGLTPAALAFIMLQLAKPLLRKRAQALAPLVQDRPWDLGSCPICGSLPEMALLQGEGGQRWMRCSLCAHHWRFSRTACPVCANDDPDKLEFFYAEGRERERVDCCKQCGKYVVCLDARGLDRQPLWEVAALGLVHLDMLAQQKGLTPASWCAWNQVK